MAMPALEIRKGWTAERVRQLPQDGNRYEVVDGELLVSAAPGGRHQRACAMFWRILDAFVVEHGLGLAMVSPSDLEYSSARMVQPDLYVVPTDGGKVPANWDKVPRLLLVIEVLSPSTARFDRVTKRKMYLDEGVPEYWIVDLHARVIERWRRGVEGPDLLDAHIEWHPAPHAPTLSIDLTRFFSELHDPWPEELGW